MLKRVSGHPGVAFVKKRPCFPVEDSSPQYAYVFLCLPTRALTKYSSEKHALPFPELIYSCSIREARLADDPPRSPRKPKGAKPAA
jgi:hypothetical protein